MKEWLCGIFQINDGHGEPFYDPVVYALFLNQLTMVSSWAITGEYNKDGIFHTHAMLRTGTRSDSLRRSIHTVWQNLMLSEEFQRIVGGQQATIDCLKLQRCHKPSSMFEYMTKNPQWAMASDERYLQFMYDIDMWAFNYRFKKALEETPNEPEVAPEINQMSKEVIDLIVANGCKTFEDCLRFGGQIMSKYLHRPGLRSIVDNCLQFVKSTGQTWTISLFEPHDPDPSIIHKILLHQGIRPSDFDPIFASWINKRHPKRNTICLQGPSNCGKSAFIAGLKQCIPWGEIVNGQTFMFEGLCEQTIGIWEEPLCSPEAAEKAKQVLEGMTCSIPVKYKKPFMLPRTPILITTNHDLWRFCTAEETAFRNRMWIYNFNYPMQNVSYTPRTVEPSCECGYCKGSRGRAAASGEPSTGRMSPAEQPISTRPESLGHEPDPNVWSGSMSGAGEGTSGSTSQQSGSADQQCSNISEHSSSTSSTTSRHMGQFRIISTRDDKRRPPGIGISVPPHGSHGSGTRDSTKPGGRTYGRGASRNGNRRGKHESSISMDPKTAQTDQAEIPTKAKKPRLGGKLGPAKVTIPHSIPLKEEWQQYLSYIYHWYG